MRQKELSVSALHLLTQSHQVDEASWLTSDDGMDH